MRNPGCEIFHGHTKSSYTRRRRHEGRFTAETIARAIIFLNEGTGFQSRRAFDAEISRDVLNQAGWQTDDVKLFIPHQANQRIRAVADCWALTARWFIPHSMHGKLRLRLYIGPMNVWKRAVQPGDVEF